MPLGSLQKFEVMTDVPGNPILEDTNSSAFTSFGHPLPFNYGCFPQTFRDPEAERHSGEGDKGDNDPLDVLDLCAEAIDPGVVFTCRPLAAVSLIYESWADWKILAVNTDSSNPLAAAGCIEDVVRINPGRLEEVLQWIDDFKKTASTSAVNFEIHDAKAARAIIERDHRSWQRLVAQPSVDGFARGHWIGPRTGQSEFRRFFSSALNRDGVEWLDPSIHSHGGAHHVKLVSRHTSRMVSSHRSQGGV
jgi:inorganic pyrophosphatase